MYLKTLWISVLIKEIANRVHFQAAGLAVSVETDQATCMIVYRPFGAKKWLHFVVFAVAEHGVTCMCSVFDLGFNNTLLA